MVHRPRGQQIHHISCDKSTTLSATNPPPKGFYGPTIWAIQSIGSRILPPPSRAAGQLSPTMFGEPRRRTGGIANHHRHVLRRLRGCHCGRPFGQAQPRVAEIGVQVAVVLPTPEMARPLARNLAGMVAHCGVVVACARPTLSKPQAPPVGWLVVCHPMCCPRDRRHVPVTTADSGPSNRQNIRSRPFPAADVGKSASFRSGANPAGSLRFAHDRTNGFRR